MIDHHQTSHIERLSPGMRTGIAQLAIALARSILVPLPKKIAPQGIEFRCGTILIAGELVVLQSTLVKTQIVKICSTLATRSSRSVFSSISLVLIAANIAQPLKTHITAPKNHFGRDKSTTGASDIVLSPTGHQQRAPESTPGIASISVLGQ